jgi:hypothetical protein
MENYEFNDYNSLGSPKYMDNKGSMCITELWPERMKMELLKSYKDSILGNDKQKRKSIFKKKAFNTTSFF